MRNLVQIISCLYIVVCCGCEGKNPWKNSLQWIVPGIERTQLEQQLRKLLARDFHYNIYTHAQDTTALYALDDRWELEVQFKAGSSWTNDGVVFPAIDSKVKRFQFHRKGYKHDAMPATHSSIEESIHAALQGIYDDLYSMKIPEFRNLRPSCLSNAALSYENGQRTIDKEYSRVGHVEYSYPENYCHLKVTVEYPSAFEITKPAEQTGIPDIFGEAQGKPFAAWMELTESRYYKINTVLEKTVDIRLDELKREIGFRGSSFLANLKKYLIKNTSAIKITVEPHKDQAPQPSYVINRSASPDTISAILHYISEDTALEPASQQSMIKQPAYSAGEMVFLKNGRNLYEMRYEVLYGSSKIGTIEFNYHNRRYLYLLTEEGNEYF